MYKGLNEHRQHVGKSHFVSVHAEMNALLRLLRLKDSRASFRTKSPPRFSSATIYVVRPDAQGELRNARPCPDCARILLQHGINRVKYTDLRVIGDTPTSVLVRERLGG